MKIETIRKQLPSGAITEIANRSKCSKSLVSQYLNGKVKTAKAAIILEHTSAILREHKKREAGALKKINRTLSL